MELFGGSCLRRPRWMTVQRHLRVGERDPEPLAERPVASMGDAPGCFNRPSASSAVVAEAMRSRSDAWEPSDTNADQPAVMATCR
jgi:hypothetical protein